MKKHTFNRKLVLSKKTVANLGAREMRDVKGGGIGTYVPTCFSFVAACRTNEDCSCKGTICA